MRVGEHFLFLELSGIGFSPCESCQIFFRGCLNRGVELNKKLFKKMFRYRFSKEGDEEEQQEWEEGIKKEA